MHSVTAHKRSVAEVLPVTSTAHTNHLQSASGASCRGVPPLLRFIIKIYMRTNKKSLLELFLVDAPVIGLVLYFHRFAPGQLNHCLLYTSDAADE